MVETTQKERDYVGVAYGEEKPRFLLLQAIYRREMVDEVIKDTHMEHLKPGTWYIIEYKDGTSKRYRLP